MKKSISAFGFFLLLILPLFMVSAIWAHGVVYEIKEDKITTIKVEYDDGEPMSYAEVKIFSPNDEKIEYQNGRTDKNGYFAFLPDQPGEWKIVVNDGMGHGIVTNISFGEEMEVKKTEIAHFSRWQKILIGVSLIWGVTGVLFYFVTKKHYRI